MRVFAPAWSNVTAVTNAASATAAVSLPADCDTVVLTNTSAVARVHVFVTGYPDGVIGAGTAPTTSTGFPILPGTQVRIAVPIGAKVIRTIATSADGSTLINPGTGG